MIQPQNATAVVLNWQTAELTVRSVNALVADGVPAERVVVVDNASGDESVETLRSELPDCRVVALTENFGFAGANNRGALALAGEAYLFVNSDAFVHAPGSVGRLLASLEGRSALSVPRLLNEDLSLQPSVVPTSSPFPELVRASGLSRFVPNRLQPSLGTHWDHRESRRIRAAVGPVVAIRADAWAALGGFAERAFMYAEDLDLCWRAAKLGYELRFVANAEFVHLGNASAAFRWSEPARAERVARAEAAMIHEHLPRPRATLTVGIMATGVGARALVRAAQRRAVDASVLRGWFRGYCAGLFGSR